MEKKIIFSATEPSTNLLWLHRQGEDLVLQEFGPNGWETIGDGVTVEELSKVLDERLETKADLEDGKVPESQLPSYVDDVLEFDKVFQSTQNINVVLGKPEYANMWVYINGPNSSSGSLGNKYRQKLVQLGANLTEDDWVTSIPESGKIYINRDNNHSYRWTGTELFDMNYSVQNDVNSMRNATLVNDVGSLTNIFDFSTSTNTMQALFNMVNQHSPTFRLTTIRYTEAGTSRSTTCLMFNIKPAPRYEFSVINRDHYQVYKLTVDNPSAPTVWKLYLLYDYLIVPTHKVGLTTGMMQAPITDSLLHNAILKAAEVIVTDDNDAYQISLFRSMQDTQDGNNIVFVNSGITGITALTYNIANKRFTPSIVPVAKSAYEDYRSAGGAKTEVEFKTRLKALIDATS